MKHQAAHACIVAGYETSFDLIDAPADTVLLSEARLTRNLHYLQVLERKAAQDPDSLRKTYHPEWRAHVLQHALLEPSSTFLRKDIGTEDLSMARESIYNQMSPNASTIELNICAPEGVRTRDGSSPFEITDIYPGFRGQ